VSRVYCLIATIPQRRESCERLLRELTEQSRQPDKVLLCLDGYVDQLGGSVGHPIVIQQAPDGPDCPLSVRIYRTERPSGGPGHKWRVITDCDPDAILVCIDDDTTLKDAPNLIRELVAAVEQGGAAAAMGRLPDGRRAPPGDISMGQLIYGCGCGLAVRVRDLFGLHQLNAYVRAQGGPNALGALGDDDALVSALLYQHMIPITHVATGNIYAAPGTQESSQTRARREAGQDPQDQKRAIARITGWPWPEPVDEVELQFTSVNWQAELSAVPAGAIPARGDGPPPPGHSRILVMDDAQPALNGVYDVPDAVRS
jgi:hypothetical protein